MSHRKTILGIRGATTLAFVGALGAGLITSTACTSSNVNANDGGVGGDGGSEGGTGNQATVRIGLSQAFSGGSASVGPVAKNAVTVAQTQINALGGILGGRRIEFVIKDDATAVDTAKTLFTGFAGQGPTGAADKVTAVIGPTSSGQASAIQPFIHEQRLLTIAPSAAAPPLSTGEPPLDRYFFRTMASHSLQARAVAELLAGADSTIKCKKAALVHHDDVYGNPFTEDFKKAMVARGSDVIIDQKAAANPADFNDVINAVIAAQPDCQFLVLQQKPGATYAKDWARITQATGGRDWTTFVTVGSNGMKFDQLVVDARVNPADTSSKSTVEGYYISIVDTNPPTAEYAFLKNTYFAQFPPEPGQTELATQVTNQYDAAVLAALAIHAAGTDSDPVKVRDQLFAVSRGGEAYGPDKLAELFKAAREGKDVDYKGASGPLDFDDQGDVGGDFVIWRIESGQFVLKTRMLANKLAQ